MVEALTLRPSLNNSPWILLYPQLLFSVASRPISAVISALTPNLQTRIGNGIHEAAQAEADHLSRPYRRSDGEMIYGPLRCCQWAWRVSSQL